MTDSSVDAARAWVEWSTGWYGGPGSGGGTERAHFVYGYLACAEAAEGREGALLAAHSALVEAARGVRTAKRELNTIRSTRDWGGIEPRVANLTEADSDLFAALDEIERLAQPEEAHGSVTYTLTRVGIVAAGDPCSVCGQPATQAVNVSTGNWSMPAQMQSRCDRHGMNLAGVEGRGESTASTPEEGER